MRTINGVPEPFTEFASQYTSEYLKDNYKEVVREFLTKEFAGLNREVRRPSILNEKRHVMVWYYTFEQYKQMAQQAINKPLADRVSVINTLLNKYINKPLKETKSEASKVYDNIRNGNNHYLTGNKFRYYLNEIAVEELIKFEMYLSNDCQDEAKNKGGAPKAPRLSAKQLLTDEIYDKDKFLLALKHRYIDAGAKEFVYMLNELFKLGYIKKGANVVYYDAFETYFGKKYKRPNTKNDHMTKARGENHKGNPIGDTQLMKITNDILIKLNNPVSK